MDKKSITISINGREIIFETGKIARQANGSVIVRSGETILLATACASKNPLPDVDFLPLRVDYQEKFSSAGKTLGGFIKREGRPTERETLVCRLIDRPLRPMFEDGWYHDTQVYTCVLSFDGVHSPEPLAICAASAALVLSDIPLAKPIAGVQVGMIDDRFIVNPTLEEMKRSKLDLMLAGTEEAILMIEGFADFLTEEQILQAVEEGHKVIKDICRKLEDWQMVNGKSKTRDTLRHPPAELAGEIEAQFGSELTAALRIKSKQDREEAIGGINGKVLSMFCSEQNPRYSKLDVMSAYKKVQAKIMRNMILTEKVRSDGRACNEVRPITIDMGYLPRTHGSAVFTRGETQSISVATLGSESMGQRYEDLSGEQITRFYLQYFFPPFSVGEVGRMGPAGRREVGHGKLAERALYMAAPDREQFPYVIRLESNITESNGSSSMASVCGGCLAMMDAGVPIKHPISGIAMGLILEGEDFAILSDILGSEDALGDMDFKVAGSDKGITAFQLDIKIEGITTEIMRLALAQAKEGRIHILEKMLQACPKSKSQLSAYAPRIEIMQIKPSKIGTLIGPGGKQIRAIIEESGANIDINDEGIVSISATTTESMEKAKQMVHSLTADAEVNKIYAGKIVKIVEFGAFVELFPGKEGLCHVSELSHERIQDVRKHFREGDKIEVKVLEINDRGQIRLSHKAVLPVPAKNA